MLFEPAVPKSMALLPDEPRATSPTSPPSPFINLPLEIRELVFTKSLLASNPSAWDWAGPFTHLNDPLALSATRMQPPALARLNRQLRAELLALLFRTTTFRVELEPHSATRSIDQRVRLRERMQGMSWFGLLDQTGKCGIRRLQLRLPVPDSKARCANLNLAYTVQPDRWEVELVIDQGFADEQAQSRWGCMPPRPMDFEIGVLKTLLESVSTSFATRERKLTRDASFQDTRHQDDDVRGLDWAATARLIRIVDLWYVLNERAFQYREFQATVLVPRIARRRNGRPDGRTTIDRESECRSAAGAGLGPAGS